MNYESGQHLARCALDELFPDSLFKSPAVSIRLIDTVGEAATLLSHYLESFTDSLLVTKDNKPIGVVGGIELLDVVLKNSTYEFFDNTTVEQIMNEKITIVSN